VPNCIIITGMHRSGTSLFAHYLSESGVELGDHLLPPDRGNPKGYFEDQNIVELHNDILRANGCHYFFNIKRLPKLQVEDSYKKRARKIIQQKKVTGRQWGWKDPRTSLFLHFWSTLINDEVKYIFLFRNPLSVCDSLIRRGTDKMIEEEPVISLKSWIIYNKQILSFFKMNKNKCVLINIDSFVQNEEQYRGLLNKSFKLDISHKASNIIQKEEIKKERELNTWHNLKIRHPLLYGKAMLILKKMLTLDAMHE